MSLLAVRGRFDFLLVLSGLGHLLRKVFESTKFGEFSGLKTWRYFFHITILAVCYAELLFWGCKQSIFRFQVSFCHVKRGNRAGSCRNEFDYSRRGTYPDQFSASRLSRLQEFRTSSFFNHLAINRKKKVDQTEHPFWSTVSFVTTQLKNELVQNSRNCVSREAVNWSGYLSESSQTHS